MIYRLVCTMLHKHLFSFPGMFFPSLFLFLLHLFSDCVATFNPFIKGLLQAHSLNSLPLPPPTHTHIHIHAHTCTRVRSHHCSYVFGSSLQLVIIVNFLTSCLPNRTYTPCGQRLSVIFIDLQAVIY